MGPPSCGIVSLLRIFLLLVFGGIRSSQVAANLPNNTASETALQEHNHLVTLGEECNSRGDLQCAYDNYWAAVRVKADSGVALAGLGLCLFAAGEQHHAEAREHLRRALQWLPPTAKGCLLRISSLEALAEAVRTEPPETSNPPPPSKQEAFELSFAQSLALFDLAEQWGTVCNVSDDMAVASLMRRAWFSKGMHSPQEQLRALRGVLARRPDHVLAHLNIGNVHFEADRYNDALTWYKRARDVALSRKDKLLALNNLGSLYRASDHIEQSLRQYLRGLALLEQQEELSNLELYTLDNSLIMMGICVWWRGLEAREQHKGSRVLALVQRRLDLDRQNLEGGRGDAQSSLYSRDSTKIDLFSITLGRYTSLLAEKVLAQETCVEPPAAALSRVDESKFRQGAHGGGGERAALRVGYLSYDWRNHPMGRLTGYFVTHHAPRAVTSLAFSYGPDDGSVQRARVQTGAAVFVDLSGVPSDDLAADEVQRHELDVAVDLTLWTEHGRVSLVNRRLAPVTINYLGYPGTSGCSGYDFALVDRRSVPVEAAASFTERLIYVPSAFSYQANDMPLDVAPCQLQRSQGAVTTDSRATKAALRQQCQSRIEDSHRMIDISTENIVLCSFNAEKKYEPVVFTAWMNILRRVPRAVLFLLVPRDFARSNILQQATSLGIHPQRLVFMSKLPWRPHLRRAAACDLLLDTFVYGAHSTATDLLWQWVPLVSLASWGTGRMPSRVAASILHSLSWPTPAAAAVDPARVPVSPQPHHAVAYSVAEYEDIVVRLAQSEALLLSLKIKVAANSLRSFAFDKVTRQRVLEQSYQLAWEIRGLLGPGRSLFHLAAGDAPLLRSSGDHHHHEAEPISELTSYALTYLHAIDCRIAKVLHGQRPSSSPEAAPPSCEEAHPEDGGGDAPAAAPADGGQQQLQVLRAARQAVLLRLAVGAPDTLSAYKRDYA